ncbi:7923_t:CDS:2 [Funneliformis caledonium]|uniref:7923_t:CDS:1 n=1 Tax=Funneliformis caledonium TaxID=1117310 RepID=A0A9N8Z169_9GLOM|nr:7923_t:CDS:2 [Funneliformis caledonium]
MYIDGHERDDIVAYRKEFLETMASLMPKFIGNELEIRIDSKLKGWRPKNEQPLRKKRQGRTIYVNDFLTNTIGRLKINEEEIDNTILSEACVIINPEKNFDGWWNIDQLIDQVFYYNN